MENIEWCENGAVNGDNVASTIDEESSPLSSSSACSDDGSVFSVESDDVQKTLDSDSDNHVDVLVSRGDQVKQSLVDWTLECNIPRIHVSKLLRRLFNDACLTSPPLDSRTLL